MKRRVYVVSIQVPFNLEEEFSSWLTLHMKDMQALPCFQGAELLKKREDKTVCFMARYFYKEPKDWQNYLSHHAQNMRGDLPESFRSKLQFSRWLSEEDLL